MSQGFENLSALFRDKLASSGLTVIDAERLDYTALNRTQVAELKFWRKFPKVPALRLPYHDPWGGDWGFARYRALLVPNVDKFPKYVQPAGSAVHAYFPRLSIDWPAVLGDPAMPLLLTEGELKAAKACKEGFAAIGLGGVNSFKTKSVDFLPELERVAWRERHVTIVYDSDVVAKPEVQRARMELGSRLLNRGALVHFVDLPQSGENKTGLDDFLVAKSAHALQALLDDAELLPIDWKMLYQWGDNGPIHNVNNVLVALREAPELKDVFGYDLLSQSVALTATLPNETFRYGRHLRDTDTTTVQTWLQREGLLPRVSAEAVRAAIYERAAQRPFHPIVDWLNALPVWDQVPRAESWLTEIFSVEATPYVRHVERMFLIAMVARVLDPGCKMDYMLVLEGSQGIFKSTVFEELAGGWFGDDAPHVGSDEVRLSTYLRDKWLVEFGELATLKRAEIEDVKRFITRRVENYIPKYGRELVREPRQCVLVGTTNQETYLKDDTGNRRFWPVRVPVDAQLNRLWLTVNRDQLFSEALHRYRAGECWYPDHELERALFQPEQATRQVLDELEEPVLEFLAVVLKDPEPRVTTNQLMTHLWGELAGRRPTGANQRLANLLRRLGWAGTRSHGLRTFIPIAPATTHPHGPTRKKPVKT